MIENLRQRQGQVSKDIRRAAEDKDVRENAPLEAAREQQGHLTARIRSLETTLRAAVVNTREHRETQIGVQRARLGSSVALEHSITRVAVNYILVSPSEADPLAGKLSVASPVGQAVLDRAVGEDVEVSAPGGKVLYRIISITD